MTVDPAPLDALGCTVKTSSESGDKPGCEPFDGSYAMYDTI